MVVGEYPPKPIDRDLADPDQSHFSDTRYDNLSLVQRQEELAKLTQAIDGLRSAGNPTEQIAQTHILIGLLLSLEDSQQEAIDDLHWQIANYELENIPQEELELLDAIRSLLVSFNTVINQMMSSTFPRPESEQAQLTSEFGKILRARGLVANMLGFLRDFKTQVGDAFVMEVLDAMSKSNPVADFLSREDNAAVVVQLRHLQARLQRFNSEIAHISALTSVQLPHADIRVHSLLNDMLFEPLNFNDIHNVDELGALKDQIGALIERIEEMDEMLQEQSRVLQELEDQRVQELRTQHGLDVD